MMWQSCLVGHNRHVDHDENSFYDKRLMDKAILTIGDISNEVVELLVCSQLPCHL